MGDPLSAAASLIAVIEATSKTTQAVYKATKTLKYAQKERKEILRELRRLQEILDQAFEGLDFGTDPDDNSTDKITPASDSSNLTYHTHPNSDALPKAKAPLIEMFSIMKGPLAACSQLLEELRRICELDVSDLDGSSLPRKFKIWIAQDSEKKETKRARLWWLLHKDSIMKKLDIIRRRREELNFQIIANTASDQVSIGRRLASIEEQLTHMNLRYLFEWLAPPDPKDNLEEAMQRYEDEDERLATGQWLLLSQEIGDWKRDSQLFWVRGIPGSGKTVLTSKIITKLTEESMQEQNTAVLFYFFEFGNRVTKIQSSNMLRSFVAQAAAVNKKCAEAAQDLYSQIWPRQPGWKDLLQTLQQIAEHFDKLFLIVDALDECTDPEQLATILASLISIPNVHFFVSSRPEARLENVLSALAKQTIDVEGEGTKRDIELYIRRRLQSNEDIEIALDEDLIEKVVDQLVEQAQNMFRWVECQLDVLDNYWLDPGLDADDIIAKIKELPSGLFSTYDRILENVDMSVDEDKVLWAKSTRILSTLMFSTRPFSVYEIQNILGIRPDSKVKAKAPRVHITPSSKTARALTKNFQKWCGSLLSACNDPDGYSKNWVRLTHQSVRDYLLSEHLQQHQSPRLRSLWLSHQNGHRLLAELCLAALLSLEDYVNFDAKALEGSPFLVYAANEWPLHVKEAGGVDCELMDDLLFEFLHKSDNPYLNWHRITRPGVPARGPDFDFPKPATDARSKEILIQSHVIWGPVTYCAMWKLSRTLKKLLEAGRDPNELSGGNTSPMMIAALHENHNGIDVLLQFKGNINHFDWAARTPLHIAVDIQNLQLVDFMLKRGANPYGCSAVDGNPIHVAAFHGLSDIVRILLRYAPKRPGPDICFEHNREIGCYMASPLQCAAYNGHIETIEVLLQLGANINLVSGEVGTALHAAALHGGPDVLEYLVEKGADVTSNAGRWGTVLTAAGYGGNRLTIQKLLEHSQASDDQDLRTKAKAWAESTDKKLSNDFLVRIIQEAQNQFCPTLLQAGQIGATEMARLYIDQGADREARDFHSGNTALHCAVRADHLETAKAIIEGGADIDAGDRHLRGPLAFAAFQGNLDMVKLLVENGANLEAKDDVSHTPLMFAQRARHKEVTEYLEQQLGRRHVQA